MRKKWYLFIFIAGTALLLHRCSEKNNAAFNYLNHSDTAKYVGVDECKTCHYQTHETFQHTGMGKSFHYATQEKSAALFGKEHLVYDSFSKFYYYPFWRNDSLWIREFRIENKDTTHLLEKYISHIVGSGHHTNSHLIYENQSVYQAPITFYVQKQKWDLAPGFEKGNNSRFSRILNSECLSCHNSTPKLGKNEFEFQHLGLGIDCERCHGPGSIHVALRKQGKGVDAKKEIDPTIVNPSKLRWDLQIDLCQRCHLQGLNVLKNGKSFTDFKPGMKLSDIFEIFLPDYEGGSHFDMANHSDRLQKSACFIQSRNNHYQPLTCITCHNPHISVKQLGQKHFNQVCNDCHTEKKCTEKTNILIANKEDCVKCHMPVRGAEDIPHVTVHDHYIQKPIDQNQKQQITQLLGLYSVTNKKTDTKTMLRAYLEYWEKFDKNPIYLRKAKELLGKVKNAELEIKYHFLTENYAQVIAVYEKKPGEFSAWTLYTIAASYRKMKQDNNALSMIAFARGLDPLHIDLAKFHVNLLLEKKQWEKSNSIVQTMHQKYPSDAYFMACKARLYMVSNQFSMAKKWMEKSLKYDPDDLNTWETFLNFYLQSGDTQNTQKWANKILQKYPNHPQKAAMVKLM